MMSENQKKKFENELGGSELVRARNPTYAQYFKKTDLAFVTTLTNFESSESNRDCLHFKFRKDLFHNDETAENHVIEIHHETRLRTLH